MAKLSVIIPAYNEELNIEHTYHVISNILREAGISYELIFVDDGSRDTTWKKIQKVSKTDNNVRGIRFSRNFGKEAAIYAGLSAATGDVSSVMDADLQHPPETLTEMYQMWEQGYEVIEGIKITRGKESKLHRLMAKSFYKIMSGSTKFDMSKSSDFKMLDKKAVQGLLSMKESRMFFRASSAWIGYKTAYVEYDVKERAAGQSKWSTKSLINYAFHNIISFTTAPLHIVSMLGTVCFLCSFVLLIYTLMQYSRGQAVEGYSTLLIVMLFIGSGIMISLGIMGYYIAGIYEEVKRRPRYLIEETVGNTERTNDGKAYTE